MYIISQMPESKVCFGECLEDGFYVEGKTYFDVQEKLEKHETEICEHKWDFVGASYTDFDTIHHYECSKCGANKSTSLSI